MKDFVKMLMTKLLEFFYLENPKREKIQKTPVSRNILIEINSGYE